MGVNQRKIHYASSSQNAKPIDKHLIEAQSSLNLTLNSRKLRDFPKIAVNFDLTDTIHIDLSRNRFTELPKEICEYVALESIDLNSNFVKAIPPAICNLKALTVLNLSCNLLTHVPLPVCNLNLKVLNMSNNKLVSLPDEIANLRSLIELDVSSNEITYLPPHIGNLQNLRTLNLSRNSLIQIPSEISNLSLVHFDITYNKITKIPPDIRYMHATLLQFNLQFNPLESPSIKFCNNGMAQIKKLLDIEATRRKTKLPSLAHNYFTHTQIAPPHGPNSSSNNETNITTQNLRHLNNTAISMEHYYDPTQFQEQAPPSNMRRYDYYFSANQYSNDPNNINNLQQNVNCDENFQPPINYTNLTSILQNYHPVNQFTKPDIININHSAARASKCSSSSRNSSSQPQSEYNINCTVVSLVKNINYHPSTNGLLHSKPDNNNINSSNIVNGIGINKRPQTDSGYGTDVASISELVLNGGGGENTNIEGDLKGVDTNNISNNDNSVDNHNKMINPNKFKNENGKDQCFITSEASLVKSTAHIVEKPEISNFNYSYHTAPDHLTNTRNPVSISNKSLTHFHNSKNMLSSIKNSYEQQTNKYNGNDTTQEFLNQTYPNFRTLKHNKQQTTRPNNITDSDHNDAVDDGTGPGVNMRRNKGFQSMSPIPITTNTLNAKNSSVYSLPAPLARIESFIETASMLGDYENEIDTGKNDLLKASSTTSSSIDFKENPVASTTSAIEKPKKCPKTITSTTLSRSPIPTINSPLTNTCSQKRTEANSRPNNGHNSHMTKSKLDKEIQAIREDRKNIMKIKEMIETKLKVKIGDDLCSALADGVILCHLVNCLKQHTINSIHVPSKLMPKLPPAKAKRNVENFFTACKQLGISEVETCNVADILEGRNFSSRTCKVLLVLVEEFKQPRGFSIASTRKLNLSSNSIYNGSPAISTRPVTKTVGGKANHHTVPFPMSSSTSSLNSSLSLSSIASDPCESHISNKTRGENSNLNCGVFVDDPEAKTPTSLTFAQDHLNGHANTTLTKSSIIGQVDAKQTHSKTSIEHQTVLQQSSTTTTKSTNVRVSSGYTCSNTNILLSNHHYLKNYDTLLSASTVPLPSAAITSSSSTNSAVVCCNIDKRSSDQYVVVNVRSTNNITSLLTTPTSTRISPYLSPSLLTNSSHTSNIRRTSGGQNQYLVSKIAFSTPHNYLNVGNNSKCVTGTHHSSEIHKNGWHISTSTANENGRKDTSYLNTIVCNNSQVPSSHYTIAACGTLNGISTTSLNTSTAAKLTSTNGTKMNSIPNHVSINNAASTPSNNKSNGHLQRIASPSPLLTNSAFIQHKASPSNLSAHNYRTNNSIGLSALNGLPYNSHTLGRHRNNYLVGKNHNKNYFNNNNNSNGNMNGISTNQMGASHTSGNGLKDSAHKTGNGGNRVVIQKLASSTTTSKHIL